MYQSILLEIVNMGKPTFSLFMHEQAQVLVSDSHVLHVFAPVTLRPVASAGEEHLLDRCEPAPLEGKVSRAPVSDRHETR